MNLMRLVLIYFLLLFPFQTIIPQDNTGFSKLDSVLYYRNLSKNNDLSLVERLKLAKRAADLSSNLDIDTTTVLNNRNLSFLYLMLGDYEPFRKVNHQNLELATKLKDTLVIAIANSNLAYYYDYKKQNDSAFYYYTKSLKKYEEINNLESQASILSSIANIQWAEKDYVGSEESAIQSLKLIQKSPQTERNLDRQWILYNLLGIISRELKQYDKALDYYEKAIEISNKQKSGYSNKYTTINNIASIIRNKGEFVQDLELYQIILYEIR
jgi:tetratricopeptide (TPR) repeat protein